MTEKRIVPRIKICGITSAEDALHAAAAGVDAVGLVFYEPSPRFVSVERALAITGAVGPFVTVVALFVDASPEEVRRVLQVVPVHVLQFHGDETAGYCEQFRRPWVKALRMKPGVDIQPELQEYRNANAFVAGWFQGRCTRRKWCKL